MIARIEYPKNTDLSKQVKLANELYEQDQRREEETKRRASVIAAAEEAGIPAEYMEQAANKIELQRNRDEEKHRRLVNVLLKATTAMVALAATVGIWHIVALRISQQAFQREQQYQHEVSRSLAVLQVRDSNAWFGLYPGDNGQVGVNINFVHTAVRAVSFNRDQQDGSISVNVGLLGIRAQSQAPTIYIGLYDENGRLLARSPIVQFVNSELKQGETREVEDHMDLNGDVHPAIVSVDEGPSEIPTDS